jgi:glycosyltransferase involved in cell wall biosynthesis
MMAGEADDRTKKPRPKVSVVLLTYNHEKWITQAVESVLMQETDFDYEVTIVEDCSTDGTREMVLDLRERFPEQIRLKLSAENGEYRKNLTAAFLESAGIYIAQLDGDDYWTSPHKLQKQADYLDAHPECVMCFHNVRVFDEDGAVEPWYLNSSAQEEITGLEDLLVNNYIASCSPMLRQGVIEGFPDWYYTAAWADWPLYLLHARHGKVGYLDEVMGARRFHSAGMWAGLGNAEKVEYTLRFYEHILPNFDAGHRAIIQGRIAELSRKLARQYRNRLRRKDARLQELEQTLAQERQKVRRLRRRSRRISGRLEELEKRESGRVANRFRGALRRVRGPRSQSGKSDEGEVGRDGSNG